MHWDGSTYGAFPEDVVGCNIDNGSISRTTETGTAVKLAGNRQLKL